MPHCSADRVNINIRADNRRKMPALVKLKELYPTRKANAFTPYLIFSTTIKPN